MSFIDYVTLMFISLITNIVPAFMPPTWMMLSIAKINNPALNIGALALAGVIGSVIGKYIMYVYCKFFARFVPEKEAHNLKYFKKFVGDNDVRIIAITIVYSLGPFPSNFLFLAFGLSKVNVGPVLIGFFLGRFVSYALLADASFKVFNFFTGVLNEGVARIASDFLGIFFAIAIIFVKWDKIYYAINKLRSKSKENP